MVNENDFSPSPARLVESLRDTGYSLPMSIADIIDNSIAAEATKVELELYSELDGNLRLRIIDNGIGMTEEELVNGMKYGSKKRVNPKSLGKFGMGLKTASTAFCRSLTVISKRKETKAKQWDLDEIILTDQWKLLTPNIDDEDLEVFHNFIGKGTGTMVVWDKIDRLVKSKSRIPSKKQLDKIVSDLRKHLSGVFGRFIENSKYGHNKVQIKINDVDLDSWDPFAYWIEDGRLERVIKKINATIDEKKYSFDFNVHILPIKAEMSSEEQLRARYQNEALQNQGFHIYRENRLIYSGGWPNRMFARESHMNLLRVELNFPHELDEYFQIDIKKSGVVLPTDLFHELKKMLTPLRREADSRYRKGKAKQTKGAAKKNNLHENSSNSIKKHTDETVNSEVTNIDPLTKTADVKNQFGKVNIKISVEEKDSKAIVETKESLLDGILWQYAIINGEHGVHLNGSHEFYRRFYLNHSDNTVLIQSMDFLFWSLAEAELQSVGEKAKLNLEEMRFSVSKILRRLAEELPEVKDE